MIKEIRKISIQRYLRNENCKVLIIAILYTFLIFSGFIGQYTSSNVLTFSKWGDQDKFTYAFFMKIREIILNKESFIGVDSGSFSGSTEWFLRVNMPAAYFFCYLFAFFSLFFPPRAMYMLLYMSHMFFALISMQKLCRKYFSLSTKVSIMVTGLYVYQLCIQSWYLSFYIITSLSVICVYAFLEFYYKRNILSGFYVVLCTICAVSSGYITVSVALLVSTYLFTLLYILFKQNVSYKYVLLLTVLVGIGGVVCLPYLFQIMLYIKHSVKSSMTLFDATAYQFKLTDILSVISSFSFINGSATEGVAALHFGLLAVSVILVGLYDKVFFRMEKYERKLIKIVFVVFALILLWANSRNTAFACWMFSFLPVLGQMHIPNRYVMFVMPFVYIGIGLIIKYIRFDKTRSCFQGISFCAFILASAYIVLAKWGVSVKFINSDRYIIEMIFLAVFAFGMSAAYLRLMSVVSWGFVTLLIAATYLYDANSVYELASHIRERSIIYNEAVPKIIDDYINRSELNKECYRYVAYDSMESVPSYLMSNYEWYNLSKYNLCNYTGYESHLCTPYDYRLMHWWFNQYDWDYVKNTRADFIMTDQATIDSNRPLFDMLVDWEKGAADLGCGRLMFTLRKFIPSIIAGESFFEDRDSFDNGYFYSHDLSDQDISSFSTNQNSKYQLSLNSPKMSVVAFLPYPNRYYHYYMDGKEFSPEIMNMEAVIRVPAGEHTICILYKNLLGTIGFWMILGMSAVLFFLVIVLLLWKAIVKTYE